MDNKTAVSFFAWGVGFGALIILIVVITIGLVANAALP